MEVKKNTCWNDFEISTRGINNSSFLFVIMISIPLKKHTLLNLIRQIRFRNGKEKNSLISFRHAYQNFDNELFIDIMLFHFWKNVKLKSIFTLLMNNWKYWNVKNLSVIKSTQHSLNFIFNHHLVNLMRCIN